MEAALRIAEDLGCFLPGIVLSSTQKRCSIIRNRGAAAVEVLHPRMSGSDLLSASFCSSGEASLARITSSARSPEYLHLGRARAAHGDGLLFC